MSESISGQGQPPAENYQLALSHEEQAQLGDAVHNAAKMVGTQGTSKQVLAEDKVEQHQQAGTQAKQPVSEAGQPKLIPPGQETPPNAETAGNAWLSPSWLVDFLEEMSEYLKQQMQSKLMEGQTKVKGMEHTQELGKAKAAEILAKGMKEAAQHMISAVINGAAAIGTGVTVVKRAQSNSKQNKIMKQQEDDPTAGMLPSEKAAFESIGARKAQVNQNRAENAAAARGERLTENTEADVAKSRIQENADNKELSKLEIKQRQVVQQSQQRQTRNVQMEADKWQSYGQIINQLSQSAEGVNRAVWGMMITMHEKEKAEIEMEEDINRQFTQSAGESARAFSDNIGSAISAMDQAARSNTQSFKYTQQGA